jgi:hypothetical protein
MWLAASIEQALCAVSCLLQCLPEPAPQPTPTPPPAKDPKGVVTGVNDPKKLQEDLTCNCPRAVTAAKAVATALAQSGNNCGSGSGQALARESEQARL